MMHTYIMIPYILDICFNIKDGKSVKSKVSLMDIPYPVPYEPLGHMIYYIQVQLNTFDTITKDK